MFYLRSLMVTALIMFAVASGCSGAHSPISTNPSNQPQSITDTQSTGQPGGGSVASHRLWLYTELLIDPATGEYEIFNRRDTQTHLNVLAYLEKTPCTNCFKVITLAPSPETLTIGIEIDHPFPLLNLTGFDVRGIVMFNGSHQFPTAGLNMPDGSMGDAELLNADGYTTLYNHDTVGKGPGGIQGYIKGKYAAPVAPNAHLNGFKRFATTEAGNTRNAFYAGKYAVASYEVDKPSGPFILGYAVDAHWAPPKNKPVVDPMTDFGPDANCPEPWKISLSAVPIGDGLTEVGGQATLTIDVYDRTGKNSHHSPLAECPELFNGTVSATFKQDFTGYARYEATVSNTKLAVAGQYRCLVSVEDNANSSSPAWLDLTAYQMIKLTVNQKPNEPPVASADAAKTVVNIMEDILFTDTSTDPDGYSDIVKWEWDLSYVEAQGFHNDHSGSWDIYHYSVAGVYQVQLRVTDSASHTDMLDTPITITVNYINLPPNVKAKADKLKIPAGGTVQFTDQSTDPDGPADMVKWEWDFSYWADDGFNVDSSLKNPTHQFNTAGLYVVMLKVTDTADNVGWLFPYPINITVQ